MKKFLIIFCMLSSSILIGCSWFGNKSTISNRPSDDFTKRNVSANFLRNGKIINKERLRLGGNVLILPFKAGENVEVTDQLDQASLMMIRGILDILDPQVEDSTQEVASDYKRFNFIFSEEEVAADLIIDGLVIKMGEPTNLGKWVLQDKKIDLEIKGKIIEKSTGNTVAVFDDYIESKVRGANYSQLGEDVGRRIGQFILKGTE